MPALQRKLLEADTSANPGAVQAASFLSVILIAATVDYIKT